MLLGVVFCLSTLYQHNSFIDLAGTNYVWFSKISIPPCKVRFYLLLLLLLFFFLGGGGFNSYDFLVSGGNGGGGGEVRSWHVIFGTQTIHLSL